MKEKKLSLSGGRVSTKASKRSSSSSKPMDFASWVEHYVQMSKGNPV